MAPHQGDLYERELHKFRAAFDKDPSDAMKRFGWTLLHSLPGDEYAAALRKLGFDLKEPADVYNLAVAAAKAERWDEAIALFSQAASKDVTLTGALYNLAICYARKGDRSKAAATLDLYLKSIPDGDEKTAVTAAAAAWRGGN